MKVALCTTTINVPHVLKLYRAGDPPDGLFNHGQSPVKFFVAGDRKTPHEAAGEVFADCVPLRYNVPSSERDKLPHPPTDEHEWKCDALIGPDSIQRRNIAFLEALKWGADEIISVDDDNIPIDAFRYFEQFRTDHTFDGVMAVGSQQDNWFDVGSLLRPQAKHRGFPYQINRRNTFTHTTGARIGVSAGICLGDPDIDATTRMALAPEVHQVSQLLEAGIVCNPNTWTVFNSQNTAILADLLPAWGMIPFVGRMDDIYASLICQRVMRERNLHVHFGPPFVWQQRNEHNLVKDLRGEIDGYENVERLAELLDHVQLTGKSVIDDTRRIWDSLNHCDWMPGRSVSAMFAYIDDCESVMVKVPA